MFVKFEPSGTQIWGGKLKVRLDLYPETTDKVYSRCLVTKDEFDQPLAIPQLNPCLCHFITVEPTITPADLGTLVRSTFLKDDLTILDNLLVDSQKNIREIGLRMLAKKGSARIAPIAKDIEDVKARLAGVVVTALNTEGRGELPLDTAIDVGGGAIDGDGETAEGYTYIDKLNPANETGTIDTVQIWLVGIGTSAVTRIGFFYLDTGTTYICRTGYLFGTIAQGSLITVTGLSLAITSGDFIGDYSNKKTERQSTGGLVILRVLGEYCDTNDSASYAVYTSSNYRLSLYGSGATAETFIPKIIGVI